MSMADRGKAETALTERALERHLDLPEGVRLRLGPEEQPERRVPSAIARALETYAAHLEAMAMKEMHDEAKEAQA